MQQRNVVARDFYIYTVAFGAIAANTNETGAIQVEADSDFEVQKLTAVGQLTNKDIVNDPVATVTILDTGSGRNLMNQAVPVSAFFGSGELPFILPTPKLFLARTTISLNITNINDVDYDGLWLSFIGRKIFYGSAPASLPPQPMVR